MPGRRSASSPWRVPSASPDVVVLQPPPPTRPVAPVFLDLPAGERLVRIFDPTRRHATALTFRANGPRKRFDHHRGKGPEREPDDDPARAVYYAAWSADPAEALSSCLVEVFGDTGIVVLGDLAVALPTVMRSLRLLDLRGRGAMRAGTVAAIAKCEHRLSQPWSRYFYETEEVFGVLDGLIYRNAHNDEPAVVLYERARSALVCPADGVARLDDPDLRPLLVDIMRRNQLVFGEEDRG
jgi:hypothetical protein